MYQCVCLVQVLVIDICVYLTLFNAQHTTKQKLSKLPVYIYYKTIV